MIPWRTWLISGGVGLLLLMALAAERGGRLAAESERDNARAQVVVQTGQADLNTETATIVDKAQSRAVQITLKSERAADVVQAAVGADTLLPDAVRDAVLAGIGELRVEAAPAGVDGAVDPGGAKPQGALPAPGG